MMRSIEGKIVIITGAAGNLGQAVAQAFQTAGAGTALVDCSTQRRQSLYGDIVDDERHLLAGEIDLTSEQAVQDSGLCSDRSPRQGKGLGEYRRSFSRRSSQL